MHCYKYKNISCALYVAACNILLTMISHDFATYSTNITLLINWHITSGLNRIYIVPYWLIYQLFLTDDVPCCAPLLSHLYVCCVYNIKFQSTFWFCVNCIFALWLPVKLPCLCVHAYIPFSPAHTLLWLLAYTCPMGRLQCYCMHLVVRDMVLVITMIIILIIIPIIIMLTHWAPFLMISRYGWESWTLMIE